MSLPAVSRAVVRGAGSLALPLALVAIVWSARLYVRDGVDITLLGLHITTNDPVRPLVLSVCLFLVFVATHGMDGVKRVWARARSLDDRLTVTALSVTVVVLGLLFGTRAATSSDPYGYVSEADLWLRGNLKTTQPWVAQVPWPAAGRTFTPLGYHPRSDYGLGDETTIVPTYAPGLPLLMAGAKAIGGEAAVFWVVPLCGGLLVFASYGLGCCMASSRVGLAAAWLVATSPILLYMVMWPMSDVPVAAAWAVTCWLLLRSSVLLASGAGAACALVVLIRPNLAWMCVVPVLWYGIALWRGNATQRNATLRQLVAFSAVAATGPLTVAAIYAHLYGSPLQSGYGDVAGTFSTRHVIPNLRNYVGWLVGSQSPLPLFGLVSLFLPIRRLWPAMPQGGVTTIFGVSVFALVAYYSAYLVFDAWWYLRFLLPAWPLLMLGLAAIAVAGARTGRSWLTAVIVVGMVLLGVQGLRVASDRFAFDLWRGERRYVAAAEGVRAITPPNSVVFAVLHSGSARYYAGRVTLRFDELDPAWLDRSVGWLLGKGVHSFLLVDDLEVDLFRARFAGQSTLARLDAPPVFTYVGSQKVFLFALGGGGDTLGSTVVETWRRRRVAAPAPFPTLTLASP